MGDQPQRNETIKRCVYHNAPFSIVIYKNRCIFAPAKLIIEVIYTMKKVKLYTSPDCETHTLRQMQVICASIWSQNGSLAGGYNYDDDYDELD